jgi:NCS1 family nucleobase:cation symporter-1
MKKLVYIKVVVFFGATIALTAWTLSLAGNSSDVLNQPAEIQGSEKSWMIVKFTFLGLASCGTFISNAADLQRYARMPNDVIVGQVISFPISNMLVCIFGNVIAAASKPIFGEVRLTLTLQDLTWPISNGMNYRLSGILSLPWIC